MKMRKKPPLRCRIACKLIGASPSALMYICALGRMSTRFGKCKRCPAYFHKFPRSNPEWIEPIARGRWGKKINIAFYDEMHEHKPSHQKEVNQ